VTVADLPEVVATGDRWASLVALRDLLAAQIEAAVPRDVAALSRQLRDVMADLDARPDAKASPVDELKERRTGRRKAASSTGS